MFAHVLFGKPVATFPGRALRVRDRLERAIEWDFGRALVVDDVKIVLELLAGLPLTADQRRSANVRHRVLGSASLPGERADQRVVLGGLDCVADLLGRE